MKAAQLLSPRVMEVQEIAPPPEPGAGQVLVKLKGIGICGSDLHYYLDGRIGHTPLEYPSILGHEPAAEIAALGPGVTGFSTGQLVGVQPAITCGNCEYCLTGHTNHCKNIVFMGGREAPGFFCEYAVVPAANLEVVPAGMSWQQVALVEPMSVVCHSFDLGPTAPGDTVVVIGAGPIGLLSIALARLSGATRIIAGDKIPHRVALAKKMGADVALHLPKESIVDAVNDLTGGRGADVVYETAAAARETITAGMLCVRPGGTFVLIGIPYEMNLPIDLHHAITREIRFLPVRRGNHCGHHAIGLIHAGRIPTDLITRSVPLKKTKEAFAMLEEYRDGVGKIVIENA